MTQSSHSSRRPFHAIENAWSADSAHTWVFRSYLPQTLAGVFNTLFAITVQMDVRYGFAHIPKQLHEHFQNGSGIFRLDEDGFVGYDPDSGGWIPRKALFTSRSNLGKELWFTWAGPQGTVLAVASKLIVRRPVKIRVMDTWMLRLSWYPLSVADGLNALKPGFSKVNILANDLEQILKNQPTSKEPTKQIDSLLRSALTLADHIDPWTRKKLTDSIWINLYNRIQEKVGWELMVDRLMPSIADIIWDTIGYDFFELLIFSRVGKRYEEFLSYRRNMSDYGGKSMNLLLDARLVEKVIEEQEPRQIETTREDGLMNPHLAQLAQLKAGLIVPLVHEKHVHGMISLYYRRITELTDVELDNIRHIGKVLARSIENTNAHETVRRLATIDGLTGLYNRRSFTDMISREMRRILRYKQYFSLILVDIDNFKHYNDTNGHLNGDRLLTQFAQVLKTSVREQDIVCRYGGEEFAVILPHTDAGRGLVVAEKIRRMVAESKFPNGQTQPLGFVSISAGVADSLANAKTYQELIDHSDRALYRAKESGRNRSFIYSPELDSDAK
ncbi:MAG: sensor domain-containing diguanylate cyclase [bacterium]